MENLMFSVFRATTFCIFLKNSKLFPQLLQLYCNIIGADVNLNHL